ncbi:carboxylesterase/lipase family protein [Amycolatopsis jiangsuensis]|uniref:Carboxylic ester hydrolase n=1 Tax=Amycolatopsis jiangsuensis TaxID=1181879 RepID=A0A840ITX6_9PSEU|nr:carboxylesterase family protein [Amycolatopsis jiangsuensis]MBB4684434.1 para-nitrobenzyl esterase [Amycolatopsis jiangsuensis]
MKYPLHRPWTATSVKALFAALLLTVGILPAQAHAATHISDQVRIETGAIHGRVEQGTLAFHNIPYAAPPTGDLRWKAPAAAASWHGVRDTTRPGNRAMQPEDSFGLLPVNLAPGRTPQPVSEDSLNLTVRTTPDAHKNPVLVWIHGGSFTGGSGDAYDTTKLTKKGIVTVSVNYRLGALGFLADPALDPEGTGGDYGLQDQQAALRWVQRNIAAFGGDPGRVTIAGESAGGISVAAHLVAPGSRGLFDAAILESGDASSTVPLKAAQEASKRFTGDTLGVKRGPGLAARLRALDAKTITAEQGKLAFPVPLGRLDYATGPWLVSGGTVLPEDPATAIRAGRAAKVPVLTGTTKDEMRVFGFLRSQSGDPVTSENYGAILTSMGGPAALAHYPLNPGDQPAITLGRALTDGWVSDVREQGLQLARNAPVYAYEFTDDAPTLPGSDFDLGAYHTAELPYLFDVADLPLRLTAEQQRLSQRMIGFWAEFARTGNPNGHSPTTSWPRLPAAVSLGDGRADVTSTAEFAAEHDWDFWKTQSHS